MIQWVWVPPSLSPMLASWTMTTGRSEEKGEVQTWSSTGNRSESRGGSRGAFLAGKGYFKLFLCDKNQRGIFSNLSLHDLVNAHCTVFYRVIITINAPINLTVPCIIFSGGFFSLRGRLGPWIETFLGSKWHERSKWHLETNRLSTEKYPAWKNNAQGS